MMKESFDPNNINQSDMDRLANVLESYLTELERVMVIPDDLMRKHGNDITGGIEDVKKLIKKLRKGDMSVFKDPDEWNMVL